MTIQEIERLSYVDFVGYINQWNVLPGAYNTLSKWATYSNMNESSNILELACTTGFSSRELSTLTNCSGVGIDTSKQSIEMARFNAEKYAPGSKITYSVDNAYSFNSKVRFDHIVIGAVLKFFDNPEQLINKITNDYIKDGAYLLASPFYVKKTIPKELVNKAKEVFGISITNEEYKEIMESYIGFEIIFEEHNDIVQETTSEMTHYVESTINRACKIRGVTEHNIREVLYRRLLAIKELSNELRPFERYVVLVLRFRSNVYPNRYVELF